MKHTDSELEAKINIREAEQKLSDSDRDMARICEDLIDLLIIKEVITESDLPAAVKEKLDNRKAWRAKL